MTQDEIVKMAREAGLVRTGDKWVEPARWGVTELVHFAALVAAAERDGCCDLLEGMHVAGTGSHNYYLYAATELRRLRNARSTT